MKTFIRDNKILIVLIVAYFLVMGAIACARHYTYQTQTWDLAAFEQSFWNTLHGRFMFNTFENQNHFAIHFSPFLILLIPFYALWQSPYTILLLQTLALALAAFPLYFLAVKLVSKRFAIATVILYFLYPSVGWVNLFDFHAVPFAIPLILTAFYFIEKDRLGVASIFLGLAATVEEDMIVAVFFVGVYLLACKHRKYGLAVALSSLVYFILVAKVFMPALGGGIVRLDRYSQFGSTATEIVYHVITQPSLTAQTIFTVPKLLYVIKLMLPLGFVPLISLPTLILLVPGLLQNLLTSFDLQFSNFYQYDSILIPFLFISFLYGIQLLQTKNIPAKYQVIFLALTAIIGVSWNSPLAPQHLPFSRFTDWKRIAAFQKIESAIPPDASVAAYTNLVPHIDHRQNIYMVGHEPGPVDFVILDGNDPMGFSNEQALQTYLDVYRATHQYSATIIDQEFYILHRNDL